MKTTDDLIDRLSSELKPQATLKPPGYRSALLIVVLAVYGVGAQLVMGLRPDLAAQLTRPLFAAEIVLLATLLLSSAAASVISMAPDAYQKPKLLMLPYGVFVLLAGLLVIQLFMPVDARMVMPAPGSHAMECALCIACLAIVPSALIFALMRKGASVRQFRSGSFAVLAASAIGCLNLRLTEAIDFIPHLIFWHYLPTLLFAIVGAFLGRFLLKW